jgi:hypothetical protein
MPLNDTAIVKCPSCSGSRIEDKGALPDIPANRFKGVCPEVIIESGNLLHCLDCDFYFRYPQQPPDVILELYKNLPPGTWGYSPGSCYWRLIASFAERYGANQTILDVGCFEGEFLQFLHGDWRRMGIEPNVSAAGKASLKGIEVIGHLLESEVCQLRGKGIGVITLIDVLEHVPEPLSFLKSLTGMLASGGSMVIGTGAADSFPFRFFGRNYWYAAITEHVSYLTLNWFRWAAKKLGLSVICVRRVSSGEPNFFESQRTFLRLLFFSLSRDICGLRNSNPLISRIPFFGRVTKWRYPPMWREARDHFVVVLRKDGK